MQRWHLTLGLAVTAVAAAVVVPDLRGPQLPAPGPTPGPAPAPPSGSDILPPQPAGDASGRLGLKATIDQSALLQGSGEDRFLVIEVDADAVEGATRRPVHLSVVMDTSGSMAGQGKMTHARAAATELVGLLGPEDTFSLVTFDDQAAVRLPDRPVTDIPSLQRRIQGIQTGGGTNLYDGVAAGLDEVGTDPSDGVRRVVVLSDGRANIGVTDAGSLRRQAGSMVAEGVTISAIGIGVDYNEDLLAAMADAGGGAYRFVDSPGSLTAMFTEELQQLSSVVARQTQLSINLADGVVLHEVYGYDIARSQDGYSVLLGDLYSGETKKLVARVSVPDSSLGAVEVARVQVTHTDADAGTPHEASVAVAGTVTEDTRMASASINQDALKQATRAQVGTMVDSAARNYAKGDVAANQADYRRAVKLVEAYTANFEDEDMLQSLGYLESERQAFQAAPPASASGRAQVKKAKEGARALSRH